MRKRKLKIFLCDIVHNYLGAGTYMFPLNIGFIAAYTYKHLPDEVEVKLFKYPDMLLGELKANIPDVIGFSNYSWNADINNKLSQFVKSISKDTMVVFGGPNIDYTPQGVRQFFTSHPGVDFYVPFQGETPFVNLLKKYLAVNLDIPKLKDGLIDGVYYYDSQLDKPMMGKSIPRLENPDDVPSPYLTGLLDEFFNYNLIPIIETNRGCPYQCTFCAQGLSSNNKINFFSLERVKKELDYISAHVKNTSLLLLTDSNFGIVKRDVEIAKYLADLYRKTGYPRKCSSNWAKNQPDIFKIAKILKNVNLTISLQSLSDTVLEKVKRKNIDISVFKNIIEKVNDFGGISGTELILGLPGETKASHIESIKKLFDWDVSCIYCFNGLILKGSELSSSKENGDFKCKTQFRLIDSSFGEYGDILSFEAEEGILSTDTMTEDELLSFRPVHWLIQFLWNYRFYYDLLKYVRFSGTNPFNFIVGLIDGSDKAPEGIGKIFMEFKQETRAEWFDSVEGLTNYYMQPDNFKSLREGSYGKMNGKYIFKVLLEVKKGFEEYLRTTAFNLAPNLEDKEEIISDIINFSSASIIDLSKPQDEINKVRYLTLKYDLLAWRESGYKKSLESFYKPEGVKYRLYLSEEHEKSLNKLLTQYSHKNKNVTLRKMGEYMSPNDFFYSIKEVKGIEAKRDLAIK
jgi:radical SAM superfamily enzyme YgiQ (UPF0313 family)